MEWGKTLPRIERREGTEATTRLAKGFPTRRRMSEWHHVLNYQPTDSGSKLLATGAERLVSSGPSLHPKGKQQRRAIKDLHRDHTHRSKALSISLKRRIRAPVRSRTRDDGFLLCWWICSRLTNHLIFIFFGCGFRVCFNRWIRELGCFIQSCSSWWVSFCLCPFFWLRNGMSWFTPSIKGRCRNPFLLRKNKSWNLR